MKHQERFRMMLERMHSDEKFKDRIMKIDTQKDFEGLLAEQEIILEADEVDKYYKGFLKIKEMEKDGDIPENLHEWVARWNPDHDKTIKL